MQRVSHFSRAEIVATFVAGSVAVLVTGLQPVLLGALVREGMMSLSLAGAMAGLEALSIGVGLIAATVLSKTHRLRVIVVCALGVLAAANFACVLAAGAQSLFTLRAITGVMSGAIIWGVTSVLVRTPLPGRITGFFVATYTALQGVCVLLLAFSLMTIFGWKSCFILMAAAGVLACFWAFNLPKGVKPLPKAIKTKLKVSLPVICACLIILLQFIAFMSIWIFLEPIGGLTGKSPQTLQVIVSISLGIQVLGAAVGGVLVDRLSAPLVLALASALIGGIGFYFLRLSPETGGAFIGASLIFSFIWMLILPFHTQFAINIEPSGNLALNVPILQMLGGVAAPVIGGALALSGDIRDVMLLTLGCSVAAVLLTVIVLLRRDRRAGGPTP